MISTLLFACLPQCGTSFGWFESHWDFATPESGRPWVQDCPDLTGDGIPEIFFTLGGLLTETVVLDGATGEEWFRQAEPNAYWGYLSHDFIDLTGDHLPEFIVRLEASIDTKGRITVVQGGDGSILWSAKGRDSYDYLGTKHLYQDMDGDGLPDVLLGSNFTGKISAVQGYSGHILWREYGQGRRFHSGADDVNGDGISEVVLGGRGRITCLDGATGNKLWDVPTHSIYDAETWTAEIGDLNLDGIGDITIFAPLNDTAGGDRSGAIEARDGKTGALIWSAFGKEEELLGIRHQAEDWTLDGIPDFASYTPEHLEVIDGATGEPFFEIRLGSHRNSRPNVQYIEFESGEGLEVLVICQGYFENDSIRRINLRDGSTRWSTTLEAYQVDNSDVIIEDLNSDNIPDILISTPNSWHPNPRGILQAVSGADGSLLWTQFGEPNDSLGNLVQLWEVDNIPGPDVVTCSGIQGESAYRIAFSGATGQPIWRHEIAEPFGYPYSTHPVDVDGDGSLELLEERLQWQAGYSCTEWLAFRPESGEVLWSIKSEDSELGSPTIKSQYSDFDSDGIDEILLVKRVAQNYYQLDFVSADQMGYRKGLQASTGELSSANGGVIDLQVEFPPEQAHWDYHLLLSSTGIGPTQLGNLWVPLNNDYWLAQTRRGHYPFGVVVNPSGQLDPNAQQIIRIQASPNQVPSAAIGMTVHAAVISREPGLIWSFSSGEESIQILP